MRQSPLVPSGDDVVLFTGCVMDAWQREVHRAGQRVLPLASGSSRLVPSRPAVGCCTATLACTAMPCDWPSAPSPHSRATAPVLVDSADCGRGHEGVRRAPRHCRGAGVLGVGLRHPRMAGLPPRPTAESGAARAPGCRPASLATFRHVQRVHLATRAVLAPFVTELVELGDDGLCCGAGGAFSVLEPASLAGVVCERKLGASAQVTRDVVASANLGCSLHLSAGGSTRCIRCRSFSRRCRARPCPGRARVRWRPARSGAARWSRWAPVGSRVRST